MVVHILYYSRDRIDELARMKVKDVNFEKNEISIRAKFGQVVRKIEMNLTLEKLLNEWLRMVVDKEKNVIMVGPNRIRVILRVTAQRAGIDSKSIH